MHQSEGFLKNRVKEKAPRRGKLHKTIRERPIQVLALTLGVNSKVRGQNRRTASAGSGLVRKQEKRGRPRPPRRKNQFLFRDNLSENVNKQPKEGPQNAE